MRKMCIPLILLFLGFGQKLTAQATMVDGAYTLVEQMPQYPGGTDSLLAHVMAKVVYPQACADSGIQGKVYLRFIVDEKGNVTNVEAIKGPHPLLKKAALDAITGLTGFTPGTEKGKPVKVWYSLPVNFKLVSTTQSIIAADSGVMCSLYSVLENGADPYSFADFPGGIYSLEAFLMENIHYPEYEKNHEVQGKLEASFYVSVNGEIENITIKKGLSAGLDSEAIRVIKLMPNFVPAKLNKISNMRTRMVLVIDFTVVPPSIFFYFPGHYQSVLELFKNNTNYPADAKAKKINAFVKVICRVNESMKIEVVSVVNDVDSNFTNEAKRLISLMPTLKAEVKISPWYTNSFELGIPFFWNKENYYPTLIYANNGQNKFFNLGVEAFKKQNYEEALKCFDVAIDDSFIDTEAFFNRGATKLKLNDKDGACDDFRRAYLLGELDAMQGIKEACQ